MSGVDEIFKIIKEKTDQILSNSKLEKRDENRQLITEISIEYEFIILQFRKEHLEFRKELDQLKKDRGLS